jgi:hypothetical protein
MLVKNKNHSIRKELNLEAYGLTEMNSESLVAIEGGCSICVSRNFYTTSEKLHQTLLKVLQKALKLV